jgi:hypothetical protein
MAGKGPLDSFYKDSLRFGNLKVGTCYRDLHLRARY